MTGDYAHDPEALGARIPPGFTIGVSTAAFQVEGAVRRGGRGPSTWDSFMTQAGRIEDGSTAEVATGHYERYRDDIELMKQLGIDSYRFSLGWPRIQPDGIGAGNKDGIAFYDRLIDALLDAGIRPMATLYHWDTPLLLQQRGGWMNRDTAYRLGDYALLAGEAFGDRIDSWVTINEPTTVTLNGYALGLHAPGSTLLFDALPAAHHQLLGHGFAVQALRATGVAGGVGISNVHAPVVPARGIRARYFAKLLDLLHNRIFADPVLLGHYPKPPFGAGKLFRALTEVDSFDLKTIHQPLDFYGVNYYMPIRVRSGAPADEDTPDGTTPDVKNIPFSLAPWPEYDETGFGWPIAPDYLTVTLKQLSERYGEVLPPVYITEGGASFPDEPDDDGAVRDGKRIRYLADHLAEAIEPVPGIDLRGYYVWTLLDNWEWAAGYSQRFGLVHVDFDTLDRTPKSSFQWLQRVLAAR
ncbi:GH1 family beta-glucosidase [Cryobacterium sp. BB307]|uniref:GH1 family beta-glucosidase n=1 Tax=Cryobacterium sp. BB307 TaxID=2716317 RepID=UPI001445ECD9|nr:GH1 family beta-glucosidase [Cryobacterium sp. BB307]